MIHNPGSKWDAEHRKKKLKKNRPLGVVGPNWQVRSEGTKKKGGGEGGGCNIWPVKKNSYPGGEQQPSSDLLGELMGGGEGEAKKKKGGDLLPLVLFGSFSHDKQSSTFENALSQKWGMDRGNRGGDYKKNP